ncbi:hypothetical protein FKM82_015161 [Ascaphus truei]
MPVRTVPRSARRRAYCLDQTPSLRGDFGCCRLQRCTAILVTPQEQGALNTSCWELRFHCDSNCRSFSSSHSMGKASCFQRSAVCHLAIITRDNKLCEVCLLLGFFCVEIRYTVNGRKPV